MLNFIIMFIIFYLRYFDQAMHDNLY